MCQILDETVGFQSKGLDVLHVIFYKSTYGENGSAR